MLKRREAAASETVFGGIDRGGGGGGGWSGSVKLEAKVESLKWGPISPCFAVECKYFSDVNYLIVNFFAKFVQWNLKPRVGHGPYLIKTDFTVEFT